MNLHPYKYLSTFFIALLFVHCSTTKLYLPSLIDNKNPTNFGTIEINNTFEKGQKVNSMTIALDNFPFLETDLQSGDVINLKTTPGEHTIKVFTEIENRPPAYLIQKFNIERKINVKQGQTTKVSIENGGNHILWGTTILKSTLGWLYLVPLWRGFVEFERDVIITITDSN